ncbi:MAG TPA: hypothetical protein VJW73_12185 [Gemmatimonadaceae bacterium]|nr:hypothetical protein [Gemmatimonadaceae bacterium]
MPRGIHPHLERAIGIRHDRPPRRAEANVGEADWRERIDPYDAATN